MNTKELLDIAINAKENAYAHYSGFRVGAALLGKSGKVYTGCNVECASYGATNCAERTALFCAINNGEREFVAMAIVGGLKKNKEIRELCVPCGVCRQALSEFVDSQKFEIILAKSIDDYKIYKLEELLPQSFGSNNLK